MKGHFASPKKTTSHPSMSSLQRMNLSLSTNERNIQTLAIELYKVTYGLSPKIMDFILPLNSGDVHPRESTFKTFNVKTVSWGTETLAHLGPKIWSIVPNDMKNFSLSKFTKKVRKWKPIKCPCRICKTYVRGLGFVTITQ